MRAATRENLRTCLKGLRDRNKLTVQQRGAILRVMASPGLQDELKSRLEAKFQVNVDNLRELLKLFVEYAPQVIAIIMQIVNMF